VGQQPRQAASFFRRLMRRGQRWPAQTD
jgi:hypothetical protein